MPSACWITAAILIVAVLAVVAVVFRQKRKSPNKGKQKAPKS
jgi:uncharacterized membrane protein SirB2